MKFLNFFRSLLFFSPLMISSAVLAQVQDVEIQITNPLKVTLPAAERNFDKIPLKPLEPIYPPLVYGYRSIFYSAPAFNPLIRPFRVKEETDKEKIENKFSLGIGNYGGIFGDLFLPLLRPSQNSISSALNVSHYNFLRGPVEDERSASGSTIVSMDLLVPGKKISTGALAFFKNTYSNFYGYPVGTDLNKDTLGINYSNLGIQLSFQDNNPKSDFHYSVNTNLSQLWNNRQGSETDFQTSIELNKTLGKSGELRITPVYNLLVRSDKYFTSPGTRNFLQTKITYALDLKKDFRLQFGINAALEDDSSLAGNIHIHPILKFNLKLLDEASLEGYLGGQVNKISLHSITGENRWLDNNALIGHNNQLIDAGLQFRLGSKAGISAVFGTRFNEISNLFFFVNQSYDSSRFSVLYDDAQKINPFIDIYFNRGRISSEVKIDYYVWNLASLTAPFHKPEGKIEWRSQIMMSKKFLLRPYALVLWGIQAPVAADYRLVQELPAAIDLGISLDYNFSKRGVIMVQLNNLLGNSYSLLQNYPVMGLNGNTVVSWKF